MYGKDARELADSQFEQASELLSAAGLKIKKFTQSHYQIRGERFILNLYPGNYNYYWDSNFGETDCFEIPARWTLLEIVDVAINSGVCR